MRKTFHIPNMHCSGCVMTLEGIEDELPGIWMVKGSYQRQTLEVVYDEDEVSEKEIVKEIQQLGYQVQ